MTILDRPSCEELDMAVIDAHLQMYVLVTLPRYKVILLKKINQCRAQWSYRVVLVGVERWMGNPSEFRERKTRPSWHTRTFMKRHYITPRKSIRRITPEDRLRAVQVEL